MAWDFCAEIHALTGFDADDDSTLTDSGESHLQHSTQWINDGIKYTLDNMPEPLLAIVAETNTLNDSTPTFTPIKNLKILDVTRSDGTRQQPCRPIAPRMRGRVDDSDDLFHYATSSDPVYFIYKNTLTVKPTPTSSQTAEVLAIPSLDDTDYLKATSAEVSTMTAVTGIGGIEWPEEANNVVLHYACLRAAEYMMRSEEDGEVYGPVITRCEALLNNSLQTMLSPFGGVGEEAAGE